MLNFKDMTRPAGVLSGLATLTAMGLVGAYLLTRDRETLKRVIQVAAGTVERVSAALAETREELFDLWEQARDEARHEMDEAAFREAKTPHEEAPAEEPAPPAPAPKPRRRPRRPTQ
jgi:hypothetical protein